MTVEKTPPNSAEVIEMAKALEAAGRQAKEPPTLVTASPYEWIELEDIPPRPWVYGQDYCRGVISLTIAPGGLGKSTLCLTEAVAMAAGRNLVAPCMDLEPLRVWYFNLEDPKQELQRKIAATCRHHEVCAEDIRGRLFINSGLDTPVITASDTEAGIVIEPVFESFSKAIQENQIDIVILDPFVSSHGLSENDNSKIDRVAKRWARLANDCGIAIGLVHHTRKNGGSGETDTESARGAKALTDAARIVRVLNRMTADEGQGAGLDLGEHRQHFRLSRDKANLAPAENEKHWMKLVSVYPNGKEDEPTASIGAVERWEYPSAYDGRTIEDLYAFQSALDKAADEGAPLAADMRAADWAGHVLASICQLSPDNKSDKIKIRRMITGYEKSGAIVREQADHPNRAGKRPVLKRGKSQ